MEENSFEVTVDYARVVVDRETERIKLEISAELIQRDGKSFFVVPSAEFEARITTTEGDIVHKLHSESGQVRARIGLNLEEIDLVLVGRYGDREPVLSSKINLRKKIEQVLGIQKARKDRAKAEMERSIQDAQAVAEARADRAESRRAEAEARANKAESEVGKLKTRGMQESPPPLPQEIIKDKVDRERKAEILAAAGVSAKAPPNQVMRTRLAATTTNRQNSQIRAETEAWELMQEYEGMDEVKRQLILAMGIINSGKNHFNADVYQIAFLTLQYYSSFSFSKKLVDSIEGFGLINSIKYYDYYRSAPWAQDLAKRGLSLYLSYAISSSIRYEPWFIKVYTDICRRNPKIAGRHLGELYIDRPEEYREAALIIAEKFPQIIIRISSSIIDLSWGYEAISKAREALAKRKK